MIELGMHTDNWREQSANLETAVESAVKHGLSYIEFGTIHGQYFVNGLGYEPSVSLQSNPRALKRFLDEKGLQVSQMDAAFPLMGPEGSTFGVQYIQQAIRFASEIDCPRIDTTDGADKINGYSDDEVFRITCENYKQCLSWARDYDIILNVETHGPYTNNGDFLERLFTYFDSPHLGMNFDTGNSFISGSDPLEYLQRFRPYVNHVHVKDVSSELAAAVRGKETGIACSQVPIGGGVNAENIRKCVGYLRKTDFSGVLSIECYGTEENISSSVSYVRELLK